MVRLNRAGLCPSIPVDCVVVTAGNAAASRYAMGAKLVRTSRVAAALGTAAMCVVCASCGGGGGDDGTTPPPATYPVGGSIDGLEGTGLVLQNNGGNDLTAAGNGAYTFSAAVARGSAYAVTVKTQPTAPSQTCSVGNGSGTVSTSGISNVAVTCATNAYRVGGNVTGLSGAGLVLQINGGDDLALSSSGAFQFATGVASGKSYAISVKSQPVAPAQTCFVTQAAGVVGATDVTSVILDCKTDRGRFAYAVAPTSIFAFRVDQATGVLSPVSGSPFTTPSTVNTIAVTPSGKFAYVSSLTANSIYAYSIDSLTGALAQLPGATQSVANPNALTVDPSGKYVFSTSPHAINAFAIDDATGALTVVAGSPVRRRADTELSPRIGRTPHRQISLRSEQ